MKKFLLASVVAASMSAGAAQAGNIFLTGHDTDLHDDFGSASAAAAFAADVAYIRNGSTLPVLTFDSGSELTNSLTKLGVTFTNVDPNGTISASVFDATKYSAILVASDQSCGGCDNSDSGLANIATQKAAIAAFVTAGGGLAGFAGAGDPNAYDYVPTAASNAGGNPPSDGYVETASGTALGLLAENGDPTHNFFGTPGVGGLSSAYVVVEANTGNNESLAVAGATISCTVTNTCTIMPGGGGGTSVPEPASMALLGAGLLGLGAAARKRV